MSIRFAKQVIYGAFYVVLIVLIVWDGYSFFARPAASCFDGIKNEGELGIDCGGPCVKVCTASTQPISVVGVNAFVSGAGHDTFLAKIDNPNLNYAAQSFDYDFNVYDTSGTLIQSYPGQSFLYGGQVEYLTLVNQPVASSVVSAALAIPTATMSWVATSTLGTAPDFAVTGLTTEIGSTTAIAAGQLTNDDTATFTDVLIVGVFKDANGNPIGASQTELDSITPNQTEDFSVSYPVIPGIDPAATEVEAYALRP